MRSEELLEGMSSCRLCGGPSAYFIEHSRMTLCQACFLKYYERKVYNTIMKHGMLHGARRVVVAVSGGKDSMALLKVMNKLASEKFPEIKLMDLAKAHCPIFWKMNLNIGLKQVDES